MVFIQSDEEKRIAHHFDCSCALYGAIESIQDYKLVDINEISSGKYDMFIRRNLFVGSTEFMQEVFSRVNLNNVKLPLNSNRKSVIMTLKEAHEKVYSGEKLFIKPTSIKLFTGLVLDGSQYSCLSKLPDDTEVMVYEPFKEVIESEWRIYVNNNKIIDSRNYSGDFKINPDYGYCENVIKTTCADFPVAYTVDIGILSNSENVVIEFNDMWAIGNYGVPNEIYLKLLKQRYFEIINNA